MFAKDKSNCIYHENNGHEKCVVFQGIHTLLKEVKIILYKEQRYLMDKEKANIQKYSVLLKNSAFVSDGGLQM